jgi:hypothetical protein
MVDFEASFLTYNNQTIRLGPSSAMNVQILWLQQKSDTLYQMML